MTARRSAELTVAALVTTVVVAMSACARDDPKPVPRELEFGPHRVQVVVPAGWDVLDQGRQKRFRHAENAEFEIVLENLGPGPATSPPGDLDELVDWGLALMGHDQRREVKSRRTVAVDGREAVDIETWNRLDHTNPRRIFLVNGDRVLLALHTARMAVGDALAAFDQMRDSLHFVSARR